MLGFGFYDWFVIGKRIHIREKINMRINVSLIWISFIWHTIIHTLYQKEEPFFFMGRRDLFFMMKYERSKKVDWILEDL